ncbi:MAG: symmetrical bis(5'-nucleosyl)-tetraphosphatase [Candidatus Aquirickettsiella sp.]
MATYAIGDIQGCFDSLLRLLDKINFDAHYDTLWFTGDLVNRGPKSLEVLRFVKKLKNTFVVLGNHDLHLLSVVYSGVSLDPNSTLQDILKAPDKDELCTWLRHRSLLHHDANLGYTLVHAGFPPQWDLNKAITCAEEVETLLKGEHYIDFLKNMYGNEPQHWSDSLKGWERLRCITNCLTRLRFCDIKGNLEWTTKGINTVSDNYFPWFKLPNRRSKDLNILFGHWAALQGYTNEPNVYALDTGCVWGRCLTAMCLEDKTRISISCLD